MEYPIIEPPFPLKFLAMEKNELQTYYKWFMEQIPIRLNILSNKVKESKGFENWEMNYSPDSLELLSVWFSRNVKLRKNTDAEIKEIYDNAPEWFKTVEIDKRELTDQSKSIAFDIGMYIGETFIANYPNVKWYHNIKTGKRDADRGQALLSGFGKVPLNPLTICLVLAYKFAKSKEDEKFLKVLYDRWAVDIVDK